ncbi:MAG: M50 family metallopeptidase [Candidatus Geothermincolia bacterium]
MTFAAAITWAAAWAVIWKFLVVVLVIAFMILTHEMGHFFAAKRVGIKVDQFSLGFGPEIVGWTRGETRYSLKWILAGGSVKIAGMNPEEEIAPEDLPRTYYEAPLWKRAVVIISGSFVHIVIALILFYLVFWPIGHQEPSGTNKIGGVQKTIQLTKTRSVPGPAYKAGLQKDDVITSVAGKATKDWDQLTKVIRARPGQAVAVQYDRGDGHGDVTVKLLDVDNVGIMGIQQGTKTVKSNPIVAVGQAFKALGAVTVALFKGLASLFSMSTLKMLVGITPRTPEGPRSVVGAAQLTFQAAEQGYAYLIFILGELFLFLGIFNLLPLPPLDGGHLLVIVVEKVFHKEIDMKTFAKVAWVVIIVLSVVALRLALLDIFTPLKSPF